MTPSRVVLVTGAGGGLGRAVVRQLSEGGSTVGVHDLAVTDGLQQLAREVGGLAVGADIRDRAQVDAMVALVESQLGPIAGLVANAASMEMGALSSQSMASWWSNLETNLTGTFHVCQAVARRMANRGEGRIVIVASEWGVTGWPLATGYSASKGGLIALVKTLGRELMPLGIRVNGVAPGVVDTPQLAMDAASAGVSLGEIKARYASAIPLGRIAAPGEVADAISFLIEGSSSAYVGQILQPNGGSSRVRA